MEAFAKDLANRFGSKSAPIQDLFRRLIEGQEASECSEATASFGQWKQLLSHAGGHEWWSLGPTETASIAKAYRFDSGELAPEYALFAIHSMYALLAALLAGRALAGTPFNGMWDRLDTPFDWCRRIDGGPLSEAVDHVPPDQLRRAAAVGVDLLRDIYHGLVPRAVRHRLGEYYTPTWLAEHVLDSVGFDGTRSVRVLDPACGSGTFLLAAAARFRQALPEKAQAIQPGCLAGYDLNPVAVAAARANLVMATADTGIDPNVVAQSISLRDSILDTADAPCEFDYVVGNPPWIAWDHLPQAYRDATKPLWRRYGLFSLGGDKARYGGGKKDLSTLLLYTAADRYLKNGGRLGFVVTQTLFQTKDAGEGFRRFRLGPDGPRLKVLRVDDLSASSRSPELRTGRPVVALQKGEPTVYPVPYYEWSERDRKEALQASPIDTAHEGSPWIVSPKEFQTDPARLIGPLRLHGSAGRQHGGRQRGLLAGGSGRNRGRRPYPESSRPGQACDSPGRMRH